ncbi:YbjN domain-containing protein [Paenibacillus agaridevorans]|uniref:YbjN domain-containing protein n=1 Tax=Paenibacillus agaridevorans TaxID=171404 RepID=A0A2R5ERM8_9BACL|nr:YbjN domain-containing protein [Paenibacillus agaridevorans]GBG06044.1 YbjN domain-containing protein [Paenibacillus agaridevorans]
MISEMEHAKQLAELGGLQIAFEKEGFQTRLLERSESIRLHVLVMMLGEDDQGRDRTMNLNFQPLPESDIEWIRLLQLHTILPFRVAPAQRSAVERVLIGANAMVPLGGFGLDEDGEVYARYVYTVPSSQTISPDELLEVISIFHYMLVLFEERIGQVAAGELTPEEALRVQE